MIPEKKPEVSTSKFTQKENNDGGNHNLETEHKAQFSSDLV